MGEHNRALFVRAAFGNQPAMQRRAIRGFEVDAFKLESPSGRGGGLVVGGKVEKLVAAPLAERALHRPCEVAIRIVKHRAEIFRCERLLG